MKQKLLCCLLKGDKVCSTCNAKVCVKHSVEGQSLSEQLVGCTKVKCVTRVRKANSARFKAIKRMQKEIDELHEVYFDFSKTVQGGKGKKGYPLMEAARRWAIKHPTVKIVRVDDSVHANSDLVIIPHETKKKYMGATVVYIPQCTGEAPIEFFLYPTAVTKLQKVLKYLDRKKGKSKY